MTHTEDLRRLVYRVYEAINAGDVDALDGLFDADIVRHAMNEVGLDAAKAAVRAASKTARRFRVADVIVEGDQAALRVVIETADQPPDAPRPIILEIFRFVGGKVAEIWGAGGTQRPGD